MRASWPTGLRRPHRIRRKMRIARRGLHLRVPQKLADHRPALAGGDGGRCVRVAQVVDADVIESGASVHSLPDGVKAGEMGARFLAPNNPRIAGQPWCGAQDIERRLAEVDNLGAGLRVRKSRDTGIEIDVLPLERQDLAEPAAERCSRPLIVSGDLGDDAKQYQVRAVRHAIRKSSGER